MLNTLKERGPDETIQNLRISVRHDLGASRVVSATRDESIPIDRLTALAARLLAQMPLVLGLTIHQAKG